MGEKLRLNTFSRPSVKLRVLRETVMDIEGLLNQLELAVGTSINGDSVLKNAADSQRLQVLSNHVRETSQAVLNNTAQLKTDWMLTTKGKKQLDDINKSPIIITNNTLN